MCHFTPRWIRDVARSFAGKCVTLPPVGSATSPVLPVLRRNLLFFCYQVFFDYVPSSATSLLSRRILLLLRRCCPILTPKTPGFVFLNDDAAGYFVWLTNWIISLRFYPISTFFFRFLFRSLVTV